MARITEASNRLFKNVFICKSCHAKIKATSDKVLKGKVRCRKCKKKSFRPRTSKEKAGKTK